MLLTLAGKENPDNITFTLLAILSTRFSFYRLWPKVTEFYWPVVVHLVHTERTLWSRCNVCPIHAYLCSFVCQGALVSSQFIPK